MFPFPVSVFLRLILLSIFPSTLADSVTICWRTKATEGRSARWRNTVVISATCEKTGSLWSLCCQPPDKDLSPLSIICLFIYFWPHHAACRILVPQPGIKSVPPAVGAQSHNHKPPQGSPYFPFFTSLVNPGLIPGSGRSFGEERGYPLQHSCLENSVDRGARRAIVHGAAKSQTQLSY